jgi:hypothetical protein
MVYHSLKANDRQDEKPSRRQGAPTGGKMTGLGLPVPTRLHDHQPKPAPVDYD